MRIHTLQVLDEHKLKFYRLQRKVDVWGKTHDDRCYIHLLFHKQHYL